MFPLTGLDDVEDGDEVDDLDDDPASVYSAPRCAAEVIGALDAVKETTSKKSDADRALADDMHVEAADLSLVAKRGRLLAFRKGRSS